MVPAETTAAEVWAQLSCLREPRPNGSRALAEAVESVRAWLEAQDLPVEILPFHLRPYFMDLLGLWLALGGLALLLAAWTGPAWLGLPLALILVAVPLAETRFLQPAVSGLVSRTAHNLAVTCAPLLSLTPFLPAARSAALIASLPVAAYGLGMGANLVGGRLSWRPSSGAVDDGAAVAVGLALAARLHDGASALRHTTVTVLLTVGEEAQMQGALAYVRGRAWPLPASAVNLEVLGQDGPYLLWTENGTAMLRQPMDTCLNDALARAVEGVTGRRPARASLINDDALAFLRAGIAAATLGSLYTALGAGGLHSALDHPGRVRPERLAEAVEILSCLLAALDAS